MPITEIGSRGAYQRHLRIEPSLKPYLALRVLDDEQKPSIGYVVLSPAHIAELVNLLLAHLGVEATLETR